MSDTTDIPTRSLVTGATGLLGSSITRLLLDGGGEVVALVRDPARARRLLPDHPALRVVAGDVNDPGSYRKELVGVDTVFHTAAYFREYFQPGADLALMERTNVTAVRDLLTTAAEAGVPTVVHTSSVNVLNRQGADNPADEHTPPPPELRDQPTSTSYSASKVRAEAVVREFADRPGLRVPVVLPGWMWGPGDAGPTSAGRLFLAVARGEMRAVPRLHNYVVDVRDVALACVRAAARPEAGRYVVAGRRHSLQEICAAVAAVTGAQTPRTVPAGLAMAVAALLEAQARLRGKEPVATRTGVQVLRDGDGRHFSSARAQQQLGIVFRPIEQTMADTAQWYREHGFLPAGRAGRPVAR